MKTQNATSDNVVSINPTRIGSKTDAKNSFYVQYGKRIFDIAVSIFVLLASSPLLLVAVIGVYFKNNGKVFFTQLRPGLNGEIFTIYKIKTMTDEKDSDGNLLPDAQRLFPLGKLIRKLSVDELPQLINVLKGEMSLIGPRPLLVEYLPHYSPSQAKRHDVLPGITGLAQIKGRNAITWERRFHYDQFYVRKLSFSMDLYILLDTVRKVVGQEDIEFEEAPELSKFVGSNYKNRKAKVFNTPDSISTDETVVGL